MNRNSLATAVKPAWASLLLLLAISILWLFMLPVLFSGESSAERWGLFSVNYLYLVGISQFGVVFSAMLRIVSARWGKSLCQLGEMTTLASFPLAIGGFLMIYNQGRSSLLYWVNEPATHAWLSEPLLLWRNLLALLLFYTVSAFYCRWAAIADKTNDETETVSSHRAYVAGSWVLIFFIVSNTFLAWDFGMMTIPHFHSTIFPIYVWIGNFNGGASFLLLLLVWQRISQAWPGTMTLNTEQLNCLAILLTCFTLLWLYMFWAQFFVIWFGNLPHEMAPLWRQMYGHYGSRFWLMISCSCFIPFACLLFTRIKHSLWAMSILALVINMGIWLNRYLMVMPTISDSHRVFHAPIEWLLLLGPLATLLLMITLCNYFRNSKLTGEARRVTK